MKKDTIIYISNVVQNKTNDNIINTSQSLLHKVRVIHFTFGYEPPPIIPFKKLFSFRNLTIITSNIWSLFHNNFTNWIFFEPIPFKRFPRVRALNMAINLALMKSSLPKGSKTTVIICRPMEETKAVVEKIQPDIVLGDSWDVWSAEEIALSRTFPFSPMTMLENAYQKYKRIYKNAYFIPGGFFTNDTLGQFLKTHFRKVGKKSVLIIGTLCWRMNFPLLYTLMNMMKDYTFVYAGIESMDPSYGFPEWQALNKQALPYWRLIQRMDNYVFYPIKNQKDIPSLPIQASVGIIPQDPYSDHCASLVKYCIPMKFFHYMALGMPTVSTRIPNLLRYQSAFVQFADNPRQFVRAIRKMTNTRLTEQEKETMTSIARHETCEKKAESILAIINDTLHRRQPKAGR
jgi:glycosyltransferase involved in cell wall biosynthesis